MYSAMPILLVDAVHVRFTSPVRSAAAERFPGGKGAEPVAAIVVIFE
jgi:hypothetical protein